MKYWVVTGTLVFRYRYDTETGFYYLQSRYYNPEWGRFVNADGIIGFAGELLSHNMFVYCQSNAINNFDPSGFVHKKFDEYFGGSGGVPSFKMPRFLKVTINRFKSGFTRNVSSSGNTVMPSIAAGNAGVKVNKGQQDKHIPGTNNYKQELSKGKSRSILSEDPQELLNDYAGTGQKIGTNKERVDFGEKIGQYYDSATGTYTDTTKGVIHYDSKGQAHIVPARP